MAVSIEHNEHKLILDGTTTPAIVHDIQRAKMVLEKVPKQGKVYGDRGYDSAGLRAALKDSGREPHMASRALRQETEAAIAQRLATNKTIAKTRTRAEHVFGAMQHDMGSLLHRGIGLERAHSKIKLEHLVYNLRRLVFWVGA